MNFFVFFFYILYLSFFFFFFFFFFNDTATTEIYTLSLHDALPISFHPPGSFTLSSTTVDWFPRIRAASIGKRSEEHTSELQSQSNLVCRLLLEKKKKNKSSTHPNKKKQTEQRKDK